jgi:hypothetical protein
MGDSDIEVDTDGKGLGSEAHHRDDGWGDGTADEIEGATPRGYPELEETAEREARSKIPPRAQGETWVTERSYDQ